MSASTSWLAMRGLKISDRDLEISGEIGFLESRFHQGENFFSCSAIPWTDDVIVQ